MSVRERRNRKDRRAKTWEQLHARRCLICMEKISQADYGARHDVVIRDSSASLRFRLEHISCPGEWPGGLAASTL